MTNGFICDSCQSAMLSQIGGPQTAAGYIPPPATSRVSPWTVVISTVVITLGLATFLLWSKIQSAFDTQPAAVGSALPTADDAALPAALPGPDAGTRPKGPQSTTQTSNTVSNAAPQVSPQSAKEPSVITVPAPRSAESVSLELAVAEQAESSLPEFLNDYCAHRATKIGHKVQVDSVTWWPGGTGVIVELEEGDLYRQGTAQFIPKSGWRWLLSPDADSNKG